ncbi:MAG TPA: phage holin family protein [Noviherbaspirillum sp.]|uniref:phage holin family protein n=1 Tax=Noviherbaspirillum sp. TaxID=1926288 RepID=UPI002B46CE98|nr:phage holin family protein [Noviherbaspirillum sp.]HJV84771.1 phage holin family protein [Noviherbaspirillum sp.]
MAVSESVARLAASLLAIVQTRIELAATEVEEESLRYFSCLILSLAAMFCVGIAVVLGVLLAVTLYWDTHRVGVLLTLIVLFGIVGAFIGLRARRQVQVKPKLLAHTAKELSRDREMLQPPA